MSDSKPTSEDELAGTEQPFVQHLIELRDRLVKAIIAIAIAALGLALYPGPGPLYDILAAPLVAHLPVGATLIATSVISPFMVPLKILLMTAFLMALPVVLYQAWAFVAPGLYSHEKKLVLPLVVSSTVLFFIGVAFCYFFVFGQVFKFIQSFAPKSITAAPDIEAYLSFVLTMFLAFGLAFEVPIVVVVLARLGMVSIDKLKGFRSYFVVLAFIIAAVVTPPDVVSQLALAIPMCLLYELGIWAAQIFIRHTQAPADPGEAPAQGGASSDASTAAAGGTATDATTGTSSSSSSQGQS
jgi:sec-independent protein translocase protein TatC